MSGNFGILLVGFGFFLGGISMGIYCYSEVGIIELKVVSDVFYLNSGVVFLGVFGYVGCFIFYYFDVMLNIVNLIDGWFDFDGDNINDWDCDFIYFG